MRKIKQICPMPGGEDYMGIAALCNDGTLWIGEIENSLDEVGWHKMDSIPQPEDEIREKKRMKKFLKQRSSPDANRQRIMPGI